MAASSGKHDTSFTEDKDVFYRGIEALLQGWTVLQLAVQHGFGGPYGREKAQWFIGAIWQWFQENDGIEPEELEDFLSDILNAEFDTIAEDGSSYQICKNICKYFALYQSGDHSSILKEIKEIPKARLDGCTQAPAQNGDDHDDDDNDVSQHNCEAMLSNVSLVNGNNSPSAAQSNEGTEETKTQEEDDGWTVIKRGKKK